MLICKLLPRDLRPRQSIGDLTGFVRREMVSFEVVGMQRFKVKKTECPLRKSSTMLQHAFLNTVFQRRYYKIKDVKPFTWYSSSVSLV